MPTIQNTATRLNGAKVFSVLDAKSGFWHFKLEEDSKHLATFHTPFKRYRWFSMPFGISSASQVFQHHIHELNEGLRGTEVIGDDFTTGSFGDTLEEALHNHKNPCRISSTMS